MAGERATPHAQLGLWGIAGAAGTPEKWLGLNLGIVDISQGLASKCIFSWVFVGCLGFSSLGIDGWLAALFLIPTPKCFR